MRGERLLMLIVLAGGAYAGGSHWLMTRAPTAPWAIVVLLGPVLAMIVKMAVSTRHVGGMAVAGLGLLGMGAVVWHGGFRDPSLLYVLQHAGIHLGLGVVFGATLRDGRMSMIGGIAQRVHGFLTPPMARYARAVTRLWTGYFFGMAVLSWCVYRMAPWSTWSLLANVVTPVVIAALFVGEFVLRYRLHPEFERATLAQAVRAYSQPSRPSPPAPASQSAGK